MSRLYKQQMFAPTEMNQSEAKKKLTVGTRVKNSKTGEISYVNIAPDQTKKSGYFGVDGDTKRKRKPSLYTIDESDNKPPSPPLGKPSWGKGDESGMRKNTFKNPPMRRPSQLRQKPTLRQNSLPSMDNEEEDDEALAIRQAEFREDIREKLSDAITKISDCKIRYGVAKYIDRVNKKKTVAKWFGQGKTEQISIAQDSTLFKALTAVHDCVKRILTDESQACGKKLSEKTHNLFLRKPCGWTVSGLLHSGWSNKRWDFYCTESEGLDKSFVSDYVSNAYKLCKFLNPGHYNNTIELERQDKVKRDAERKNANNEAEQAVEQQRIAAVEQQRIATEQAAAKQQRIAAEQAAAEQQRIAAEQQRIAAKQAAAKQAATEQAAAEQQRIAKAKQQRIAEQQRIANEQEEKKEDDEILNSDTDDDDDGAADGVAQRKAQKKRISTKFTANKEKKRRNLLLMAADDCSSEVKDRLKAENRRLKIEREELRTELREINRT